MNTNYIPISFVVFQVFPQDMQFFGQNGPILVKIVQSIHIFLLFPWIAPSQVLMWGGGLSATP